MEIGGAGKNQVTRDLPGPGYLQGHGRKQQVTHSGDVYEGIACKGPAELKGQRVGTFSRKSCRLSGQRLWPSGRGLTDKWCCSQPVTMYPNPPQGSDVVTFSFERSL